MSREQVGLVVFVLAIVCEVAGAVVALGAAPALAGWVRSPFGLSPGAWSVAGILVAAVGLVLIRVAMALRWPAHA